MRLLFLLGCLAALSIAEDSTIVKRALPNPPKVNKKSEVVEGSGDFLPPVGKSTAMPDAEIHGSGQPGYSSDDEDSEDVHGSGAPADRVEGSGAPPRQLQTRPQVTTSTTTTTTTMAPFGAAVTSKTTTTTSSHAVFHPIAKLPDAEITDDDDDSKEDEIESPSVVVEEKTTTSRPPPPVETIPEDTTLSPFDHMLKPGIFAALVGGAVVALLTTVLLVMFICHRMRKKDEGSYALDEPKPRPYAGYTYTKASTKEFYA